MEPKNYFSYLFIVLALISTIIISIFSTYSILSGRHDFYNKGTEISCSKCHSDISLELDNSAYHSSFKCDDCHNLNGVNNEINDNTHGNIKSPRCLDCHSNIENGLINDSHNPLIKNALSSSINKGENEACIICHTKKSIDIKFTYADLFKIDTNRDSSGIWQVFDSKIIDSGIKYNAIYNETKTGEHKFLLLNDIKCERCHSDIRIDLDKSSHKSLSCKECHFMDFSKNHLSNIPSCKDCHILNNINNDAHNPFISLKDNNKNNDNIACINCHSNFNNNINFERPQYIEWDVVNNNDTEWIIQNLAIGSSKIVNVKKNTNGRSHNIFVDKVDCTSCHQDIKEAVIKGSHSNEQWKRKHNYGNDMDIYCKSCHKPVLSVGGFESHGGVKISCIDCHSKDILANINGGMRKPPYDSKKMGYIEKSIEKQNKYVQSYLCISCKNTDNPSPEINNSIHFKYYTEPEIAIYVNGIKKYP